MKICFLTLGHVSKQRGGVDRVTDTLAQLLIQRNHEVFMISVWKPIEGDSVESYQYFLPSQDILSKANISFVNDFIIDNQIDIIINQSEPMALMKLLVSAHGSVPIVSVLHTDPMGIVKGIRDSWDKWKYNYGAIGFLLRYPYLFLRKQYQLITRAKYIREKYTYYYQHCAAVVLLSERFKAPFKKMANLEEDKKLFAIPNPISFEKPSIPEQKEKIVLFVGRLEFSPKRLDRLIHIWSQIKDKSSWKIKVLGDGPDLDFYRNLSDRLNVKDIEFLGTVNPLPYYKRASILCVTSSHEGFPLVITEALQNEVIPIAFDSYETVYDLIDSEYTGYIIPSFSEKKYAEKLNLLLKNEDLRSTIRQNIRTENQINCKFQGNNVVEYWLQLFGKLLNK